MRIVMGTLAIASLLLAATAAAEPLYRCDGPTPIYTNRAELGCPVYEPHSSIRIVPEDATWEQIQALAVAPLALPERATEDAETGRRGNAETPCALYREWAQLNMKSQGGFYSMTTDERQRWMGLQKLFSLAGVPVCPERER